jgi:hypothetical protein
VYSLAATRPLSAYPAHIQRIDYSMVAIWNMNVRHIKNGRMAQSIENHTAQVARMFQQQRVFVCFANIISRLSYTLNNSSNDVRNTANNMGCKHGARL